jgi:Tol biopolymer transport system component
MPRTEGASLPFWSPDSRHIGYFADRHLKRIDVGNLLTQTVSDAPSARGGTWGPGDVIVFAPTNAGPLFRVTASGGTPQPATTIDQGRREFAHVWPQWFADRRHLLFFARTPAPHDTGAVVIDLERGVRTFVAPLPSAAILSGDRLLFSPGGPLIAQRFDPATFRLVNNDSAAIAGADDIVLTRWSGPTVSAARGVLVHGGSETRLDQLIWMDRSGRVVGSAGQPGAYHDIAISQDGRTIVVARDDDRGRTSDLWLIDDARGVSTRATFGQTPVTRDTSPVWSPDGMHLVFASRRDGRDVLVMTAPQSGEKEEQIAEAAQTMRPTAWSADGRWLLYTTDQPKTGLDVWAIPMSGERRATAVLQSTANESDAQVSPDGRWIAYVSDETGRNEVFVRSFPESKGKWLISSGGGTRPRWRTDGRELVFVSGEGMLTSVAIEGSPELRIGREQPLFSLRSASEFAMAPGGQRFLVRSPVRSDRRAELHVVLNWEAELHP